MYKILGADQQEYGPVSADELRQWIAQGRANTQTLVLTEGIMGWRPLNTFPEFAAALAIAPTVLTAFPGGAAVRTNGMAIAGFILGLFSLICCFIGPPFSILSLIFSIIGLVQINHHPPQSGKGLAIAGIILAVFGLLLFGIFLLMGLVGSALQDVG